MQDHQEECEMFLIKRAARGDVDAFAELYKHVYKELYRFAVLTLRHMQDAEDAVSDTVLAAYENIHKLKKHTSFRSWIFTILVNQCRSRFRKQVRADELPQDISVKEPDLTESCDVRQAFLQLNEDDRMIVGCSILGGYPSEEIGKMLGMNAATVRSRKARALEKMRNTLI